MELISFEQTKAAAFYWEKKALLYVQTTNENGSHFYHIDKMTKEGKPIEIIQLDGIEEKRKR